MLRHKGIFTAFVLLAVGFAAVSSAAAASDDGLGPGCSKPGDCDDDNLCTLDKCSPEGQCSNVPNYDLAVECCNPTNGALSLLKCDANHCYEAICYPMSCTCCDLPGGDPCAERIVPAAGAWGVVAMGLLVLTAATLVLIRRQRQAG